MRHIIPVAHAELVRMRRAHTVAAVVEEATGQNRGSAPQSFALAIVKNARRARCLAVQKTVRALGVETENPIAHDLQPDAPNTGRIRARAADINPPEARADARRGAAFRRKRRMSLPAIIFQRLRLRYAWALFAISRKACRIGINDFEPEIAEFVHEPWRHRSRSRSLCGHHPPHGDAPQRRSVLEPRGTGLAIVCNRHCRRRKWPSSSTKRPIQQSGSSMNLRRCESPGNAARIAALSADQAPTAIIGCPHMTEPCDVLGRQRVRAARKRRDRRSDARATVVFGVDPQAIVAVVFGR